MIYGLVLQEYILKGVVNAALGQEQGSVSSVFIHYDIQFVKRSFVINCRRTVIFDDGIYTAKKAQVATSLLTSCNNLLQQADIRCVRMPCDSLLTTSLLQVINRLVACWLSKLVISMQACYKLFQQVVKSLQMTNCNKPDFNRLVATW